MVAMDRNDSSDKDKYTKSMTDLGGGCWEDR